MRESLLIRTALEVEAVRRVTQQADQAILAELEANLERQAAALGAGDLPTFYELDEALHSTIFAALNAPRALRLLDAARAPLDRPRRLGLPEPGRPDETLKEHRRLVDAIASGDAEFAASAMRAHLARVAKSVERELEQIEGTPVEGS